MDRVKEVEGILWRKPPVLALGALPGIARGRLGEPSNASLAAWAAFGRHRPDAASARVHTRRLQVTHVFIDNDEVTGFLDWSERAKATQCSILAVLAPGAVLVESQLEQRRGVDVGDHRGQRRCSATRSLTVPFDLIRCYGT